MSKKTKPQILVGMADRSVRISKKQLTELVEFVGVMEGVRLGRIDLAVVPSGQMAGMNRRFLSHRGATDVLSFDLSDARTRGLSAQIVVCGQVAVQQAKMRGLKSRDELMLYVIHGLLHMMSYDDTSVRAAAAMHAREDELLSAFLKVLARRSGKIS